MAENTTSQLPLEQLRQIRIEKLKKLREMGINPYPSTSHRTNTSKEILASFEKFKNKVVTVAGRVMSAL